MCRVGVWGVGVWGVGVCRVWGVEYRVKCCRVKGGCGFRCGFNMWVEYVGESLK